MKYTHGFTLIELMLVVVILSILAVVAIPAYDEQVKRGRRSDAKAVLMELSSLQERFFTQNVSYASSITAATGLNVSSDKSREGFYTVAVSVAPSGCSVAANTKNCHYYQLTATPVNTDADCTTITFDSRGVKGHTGSATTADTCWR